MVSARPTGTLAWFGLLLGATACGPDGAPPAREGDAGPAAVCLTAGDCDDDGAARSLDCDDDDAAVAPGATELLGNGKDDDCDATTPDAARIDLAATGGRIFAEVPTDLTGGGTARVGVIDIQSSTGTIEVDGETLAAFVDERVPWPGTGYSMQQLLAVGAERLVTVWAYCDSEALSFLYLGDVEAGALDAENASGSCLEHAEGAFLDVTLPALSLPIPVQVRGFTVEGPAITVRDGAPGALRTDVEALTLLPYRVVDCSTGCGDPGWYELHSLLWSSTEQVAAFAIVYLHLDDSLGTGRDVQLVTSRPLPDLAAPFPDGATYSATFTTP